MNLIDAIKQSGKPFHVPDCMRDEFPKFLKEMGFQTGAEIGVFLGEFTEKLCQANLKMYGIDPWISFSGQGRGQMIQTNQDESFRRASERLSSHDCTLIRKTSMDALNDFEPNSLDFVYIDGDHRFKQVSEDIYEWYWKVRPGGIVSGDDYDLTSPSANNLICQVRPVVDAFVETYQIKNFYVFDNSWMFFKP